MSQYGYTQLSDSKPIARVKHRCTWCGEHILPKEQYERFTGVYCGDFQVNKFHPECSDACNKEAREWGYDFEFSPHSYKRGSQEEA